MLQQPKFNWRFQMKELKKRFNVSVEDLPVIAGFVGTSFESNQSDFTDYSPDFQQPYLTNYKAKLALIEEIVFPKKITNEIKVVTERISAAMEATRDPLNRLEGYASRAKNLSINPADFGIQEVRKAISAKNNEKYYSSMGNLLGNVEANFTQLSEKGFTAEAKEVLLNARKNVKADIDLQNSKLNEKGDLVEDNIESLNELWDLMADILKTGKMLYKNKDKSKTTEFTMSTLKARVKAERKKKETPPADGSVPPTP